MNSSMNEIYIVLKNEYSLKNTLLLNISFFFSCEDDDFSSVIIQYYYYH